jgi:hypothetical protein
MVAGDIVYIKKGTNDYTETDPYNNGGAGSLTISTSYPDGLPDAPIAYVGYPAQSLATGSPVIRQSPSLQWGFVTFLDDRKYYTFAKLNVIGPEKPFPIANTGRRIIANQISSAGTDSWGAVSVNNYADKIRLLGNYLKDDGTAGNNYPGFGIYGDSAAQPITDIEVGWNQVENQHGGPSIEVVGDSATPGNFNGVKIHDNLLINNASTDHIIVGGYTSATQSIDNVEIWNNVVVGSASAGVRLNNTMMNVSVVHNTLVGNSVGIAFGSLGAAKVTLKNNIIAESSGLPYYTGTTTGVFAAEGNNLFFGGPGPGCPSFAGNCQNGDPLFVNPASYDYHVKSGSPAIDHGAASNYPNDFIGIPRVAPEIGAYETP